MIDSTHRLTHSLVVAAVEDRKVCSRGSEELQPLGTESDHDSQQLPGAKMVRNFLLGDGGGEGGGIFPLGDRGRLVLKSVEKGGGIFSQGRPRKASVECGCTL